MVAELSTAGAPDETMIFREQIGGRARLWSLKEGKRMKNTLRLPSWLPGGSFWAAAQEGNSAEPEDSLSGDRNWSSEKPKLLGLSGQSTQEEGAAHRERMPETCRRVTLSL